MNLENITNMSRKDLLRSLGLAPRVGDLLLPAIGIFAAGALLGAGTALLVAPRSGAKFRRQIREEMRSKIGELEQLFEGGRNKGEGGGEHAEAGRDKEKNKQEKDKEGRHEQERGAGKKAA